MYEAAFLELIQRIREKDPRYEREAYAFVREGLDFTVKMLEKPREGAGRHVTGQELLDGLRKFALQEFGPMALTVLRTWGVNRSRDFGEIVFNLVEAGCLGRTEEDSREDFDNGYDFEQAFRSPYVPKSAAGERTTRPPGTSSAGKDRRE